MLRFVSFRTKRRFECLHRLCFFPMQTVMNETRQQAYLNLIQALLNCPNGAEQQILRANRPLIDAGLIDTMTQVAEEFSERGDSKTADFLVALARQFWVHITTQFREEVVFSKSLPIFESIPNADSQQAFLKRVLEATEKNQGNPQVICCTVWFSLILVLFCLLEFF